MNLVSGKKVAFCSKEKRFWTENELQPRKVPEAGSGEAVIQFLLSLKSLERFSLLCVGFFISYSSDLGHGMFEAF